MNRARPRVISQVRYTELRSSIWITEFILSRARRSQLLSFLMEAMESPLHASRLQSLRGHLTRGGTVADVIEQHERILTQVKARDVKGAAAAMRDHLAQTARDLRAAFAIADSGGTVEDR